MHPVVYQYHILDFIYRQTQQQIYQSTHSHIGITNTLSDAHRYVSEWIDIFVVVFDGK
jgi:hypothetical protein